jgi:short-subunit dehydrogenase
MNVRHSLIIGATSAMAEHTTRRLAADGDHLYLAARDPARLEVLAADLRVRGAAEVQVLPAFDAADPQSSAPLLQAVADTIPRLDLVLIAHGRLPDQTACTADSDRAAEAVEINFLSPLRLCTPLANRMQAQGSGTLAVIGSVAGLRGRQSNYIYGAAKGGLQIYLQGLRNRLHPHGVRVLTLLPGFVDSPMTAHLPKGPLFVSADRAGALIYRALTRSKADVVYIPGFWRLIFWIIRAIPESIFKKLKL